MIANAVDTNYNTYSEAQLVAVLDEIHNQKASLDNRERQIREILHTLGAESNKSSIVSRIGLDEPTEETRNALDNDFVVCRGYSHEEFVESLKNEAD